jgi:fibronectin type 3 domain-containing protein
MDTNGDPVVSYNVYRSETLDETYTKLNNSTIAQPQYNDTDLESGTTYHYIVTSVDAEGDESVQSERLSVTTTAPHDDDPSGLAVPRGGGGGCFIRAISQESRRW